MVMKIKVLREAAGLTQKQLADSMGVMQNAVSCWETEAALPRTRQLPRLATVLSVSIPELYTEEALHVEMTPIPS